MTTPVMSIRHLMADTDRTYPLVTVYDLTSGYWQRLYDGTIGSLPTNRMVYTVYACPSANKNDILKRSLSDPKLRAIYGHVFGLGKANRCRKLLLVNRSGYVVAVEV